MKILVDGLSKEKGGIGSLVMNMLCCSRAQDSQCRPEFVFLVPEASVYIKQLEEFGCRYYIVPGITELGNYKAVLKRVFSENSFDFLWFNNSSKVNIILPEMAVNNGARLICHTHGISSEETGLKKLVFSVIEKFNEAKFNRLTSVALACSEAAADHFYKNKELRKKAVIINNGIFVDNFRYSSEARSAIREKYGVKDSDVLLIAVGRMSEVKNFGYLVELLSGLEQNYKLLILGDGPERENILSKAEELSVKDRLYCPGEVGNVNDYLSAADEFLMPSLHEGLPFSAVEAQACGLPCIISDTVPAAVNISGSCAFAPLCDEQQWINIIKASCNLSIDRNIMGAIVSKKGYNIEQQYSLFYNLLSDELE